MKGSGGLVGLAKSNQITKNGKKTSGAQLIFRPSRAGQEVLRGLEPVNEHVQPSRSAAQHTADP